MDGLSHDLHIFLIATNVFHYRSKGWLLVWDFWSIKYGKNVFCLVRQDHQLQRHQGFQCLLSSTRNCSGDLHDFGPPSLILDVYGVAWGDMMLYITFYHGNSHSEHHVWNMFFFFSDLDLEANPSTVIASGRLFFCPANPIEAIVVSV